jgi:hypothetical protein
MPQSLMDHKTKNIYCLVFHRNLLLLMSRTNLHSTRGAGVDSPRGKEQSATREVFLEPIWALKDKKMLKGRTGWGREGVQVQEDRISCICSELLCSIDYKVSNRNGHGEIGQRSEIVGTVAARATIAFIVFIAASCVLKSSASVYLPAVPANNVTLIY